MKRAPLPADIVDEGIVDSKNSVLDKFILASAAFGAVYTVVTTWRDLWVAMISTNAAINLLITVIPTVLWFMRKRISYGAKAFILFLNFLIAGTKSILIFGTYSNSTVIFFCFCCIIVAGSLSLKWSFFFMLLLSAIIPLRGYLHIAGVYPMEVSAVQIVSDRPASWVQLYVTFILAASIITLGVGQLRKEVYKHVGWLESSIKDLEGVNRQLIKEVQLKNSFEENLIISSRKFRSLFDSNRDGVVLLNNRAEVMEANAAACDISGYSLEELRGTNIFDLVDTPYRSVMQKNFALQIQGNLQPVLTEITFTTRDGNTVPVEINSNLILTEDQVTMMSTIRDISFRRGVENEKFNAVLAAEERERERFSKDLHDDLGPVFSTLNLYLQTLSKKEPDATKKDILDRLSSMVDSAVKQVREISHNLSPYLLKDAGVIQAIATHLAKFKDSDTLKTEFEHSLEGDHRIPFKVELVIYRIFLELVNNTLKHSGADTIKIALHGTAQKIYFAYIDNGKGYDAAQMLETKAGIGLLNIENRIKSLEGSIRYSRESSEMKVEITIPI